jgi:hypothetical protein
MLRVATVLAAERSSRFAQSRSVIVLQKRWVAAEKSGTAPVWHTFCGYNVGTVDWVETTEMARKAALTLFAAQVKIWGLWIAPLDFLNREAQKHKSGTWRFSIRALASEHSFASMILGVPGCHHERRRWPTTSE